MTNFPIGDDGIAIIPSRDPTREEMVAWLKEQLPEICEFDLEEAIYWYSAEYHGGQGSNLYRALCASPFTPGPCSRGPIDGSEADFAYQLLIDDFAAE